MVTGRITLRREIKQWVLEAAGLRSPGAHPAFVEQVRAAILARYPDAEVAISYAPLRCDDRGPGRPWEAETPRRTDDEARTAEAFAKETERRMLEHACRVRFDRSRPHPEDPGARICRRCGRGVIVERRLSGSQAMHRIATDPGLYLKAATGQIDPNGMREDACSRCGIRA